MRKVFINELISKIWNNRMTIIIKCLLIIGSLICMWYNMAFLNADIVWLQELDILTVSILGGLWVVSFLGWFAFALLAFVTKWNTEDRKIELG